MQRPILPFRIMALGDSFDVKPTDYSFSYVRVRASDMGRELGCHFTCRIQRDGSMRVTRQGRREQPNYLPLN